MPWNAPKSLTPDEVYALVAYLLNLGYVVDDDFVLSDTNMAETQARMPNRNGMSLDHGLWSVSGAPDVSGSSCTADCDVAVTVTSSLPAYAMNAHGNLAEQVRDWIVDRDPGQVKRQRQNLSNWQRPARWSKRLSRLRPRSLRVAVRVATRWPVSWWGRALMPSGRSTPGRSTRPTYVTR